MRETTTLFIFVLCSCIISCVAAGVSPCTDCDGLGVCQTNGKCRCFAAYTFPVVNGTAQTNSCADTILNINPVGVKTIRGVSAGVSFILFALIMWRLYLECITDPDKMSNNVGLRRVVLFSLAMDGLICFLMFFLSLLDWWGNFNVLPSPVYNALYNLIDWLYIVLFVGILLHWAELYQKTMKSIRTRDMMKKVNSNYNGEITVEQVMSNLTFLQRFKIPFIVIAGVTFLIWIARIIGSQLINDQKSWNVFFPFMILFYAVVWIGFGIGFCFYGYKLMRVMPEAMGRKIRWITIKLNAVLFLQIANSQASDTVDRAELYQKTMKSIRTRDMMKKVNSNYNGEITVEQVMSNLTFLQRFKIPFIVIAGVTFLIWIARIIGSQRINVARSWSIFFPFMVTFYAVVWVGFAIGFGVYGYKLMRVMPEAMGRRIRGMTIKLTAVLFLEIVNCVQIILFTTLVPGLANSIFGRNAITFVIRLIVSFIVLEIYMPISKFRLWFSRQLLGTSASNGNSSGRSGSQSGYVAPVVIAIDPNEQPSSTA
ncbi:hypothetical protein PROFUN_08978 [Planoprotostelium fungivorum]|uniref:Uncharacterized protein n=1 Tax=Planoprotostelium fungivorum TaxID=1890364 RepID=A0A2P6NIJ6_9EUKA|nr:hypothetical protein PROFUN_08978 [Planoprotostelium fungivorum]